MFKIGDEVSYGIHGKCVITGIESKNLGAKTLDFYHMRTLKNPIVPKVPSKGAPAILVPVETATNNGLRNLMDKDQAEQALRILAERDYHFELSENWIAKQKRLEDALRKEGYVGLSRVVGHLHCIIKRDPAPRSDITRFYENLHRNLTREIGDALEIQTKDAEVLVAKALKNKLLADN